MTIAEWLSNILALIALIISAISYSRSNQFASASVELTINERITSTKEAVSAVSMQMAPLLSKSEKTSDEIRLIGYYKNIFNSAIENNLNAYEEACAKYLDKKVDKKRFKKIYRTEIKQLVESPDLKSKFDALITKYKAIAKVYIEWENLEK